MLARFVAYELPLFGVNAPTATQLQKDFAEPLVVRSSRDVDVRDNITDFDGGRDDDATEHDDPERR